MPPHDLATRPNFSATNGPVPAGASRPWLPGEPWGLGGLGGLGRPGGLGALGRLGGLGRPGGLGALGRLGGLGRPGGLGALGWLDWLGGLGRLDGEAPAPRRQRALYSLYAKSATNSTKWRGGRRRLLGPCPGRPLTKRVCSPALSPFAATRAGPVRTACSRGRRTVWPTSPAADRRARRTRWRRYLPGCRPGSVLPRGRW
jgi:hypothetical protein